MGLASGKACSQTTPTKKDTEKRVLDIDPRSPSSDICRTPIIVDKTPEGLLDPRSPTVGIVRTPIVSNDVRSCKENVPMMPSLLTVDNFDEVNDEKSNLIADDSLEDPDKLLEEFDQLQKLSLNNPSCPESVLSSANQKTSSSFVYQDDSEETILSRKVFKPQPPKQLFPKDTSRSPLASRNIDLNSPRNIVQRKQARKVENARSCIQQTLNTGGNFIPEKENIDF